MYKFRKCLQTYHLEHSQVLALKHQKLAQMIRNHFLELIANN